MLDIIREENYEQTMREVVEPQLAALREEIDMPLSTGGAMHAEVYETKGAKRAVVILHGYTESGEKFREMVWYFIKAGCSVFVPDHRGHGRSVRQVGDASITHVDHFTDYLRDLEELMDKIVLPRTQGQRRFLYAHSMGGAVGAYALIAHPEWFDRAILTAPMIRAVMPMPAWMVRLMAAAARLMGKEKARIFIAHPFDPKREYYEGSHSTSRARYDYYQHKRETTQCLQNCSPSYSWVGEAAGVTRYVLNPTHAARIQTPLLLCQAKQDSIVHLAEQEKFVSLVRGAQLRRFDTKHEIYGSKDSIMREYLDTIEEFIMNA